MKCPILLKRDVQLVVESLGLVKIKVNEFNYLKLAQEFGIVPKDKCKSLKIYSNKETDNESNSY